MKYALPFFILFGLISCNSKSDLPEVPVRYLDGTSQDMSDIDGPAIVVLYQPGCDHCQRAAAAVEQNLESFSDYQVYFVSSASVYENQQFANTYKLNNQPNFHFGTTLGEYIVNTFGSIPTPSFYIYSEDEVLLKKFIGETPIEEILGVL